MEKKITYLKRKVVYQVLDMLYVDVDQMMNILAPEGWENSPYNFIFAPIEEEQEAHYLMYENVAKAYEHKFGKTCTSYISRGRCKVDLKIQQQANQSGPRQMLYLIEYVLEQYSRNGLFYKKKNPNRLYRLDIADARVQNSLIYTEIYAEKLFTFSLGLTRAREDFLPELDLHLVYRQVLDAFNKLGYDWRYYNDLLNDIWQIRIILDNAGEDEIPSYLYQCYEECVQLVTAIEEYSPKDYIKGYQALYNRLPVGFPPTAEDLYSIYP